MFLLIGSNIIFNIIEYFTFINLFLLFLFIIISIFYLLINSTLLYYSNISFSHCLVEFISTLFSLLFLIIIISPALIIMLDFDLIIIPSFILYSLGIQWAWQFNIIFSSISTNYETFCDHYIISSKNEEIIGEKPLKANYSSLNEKPLIEKLKNAFNSLIKAKARLLIKNQGLMDISAIPDIDAAIRNGWISWKETNNNMWSTIRYSLFDIEQRINKGKDIITWDFKDFTLTKTKPHNFITSRQKAFNLYKGKDLIKNNNIEDLINNNLKNLEEIIRDYEKYLKAEGYIVISYILKNIRLSIIKPLTGNNEPDIAIEGICFNKYLLKHIPSIAMSGSLFPVKGFIKYLLEINQYILLPIYSFIRLYVYSFDVIHTLGFYSWGIKIDSIPGRINSTTTLRLLSKGEYRGKCFELCGQGHLSMLLMALLI